MTIFAKHVLVALRAEKQKADKEWLIRELLPQPMRELFTGQPHTVIILPSKQNLRSK